MDDEFFCISCGRYNPDMQYKTCPRCRERQRSYYWRDKGGKPQRTSIRQVVHEPPKHSLEAVMKMAAERGISYGYMVAELYERGEER